MVIDEADFECLRKFFRKLLKEIENSFIPKLLTSPNGCEVNTKFNSCLVSQNEMKVVFAGGMVALQAFRRRVVPQATQDLYWKWT